MQKLDKIQQAILLRQANAVWVSSLLWTFSAHSRTSCLSWYLRHNSLSQSVFVILNFSVLILMCLWYILSLDQVHGLCLQNICPVFPPLVGFDQENVCGSCLFMNIPIKQLWRWTSESCATLTTYTCGTISRKGPCVFKVMLMIMVYVSRTEQFLYWSIVHFYFVTQLSSWRKSPQDVFVSSLRIIRIVFCRTTSYEVIWKLTHFQICFASFTFEQSNTLSLSRYKKKFCVKSMNTCSHLLWFLTYWF